MVYNYLFTCKHGKDYNVINNLHAFVVPSVGPSNAQRIAAAALRLRGALVPRSAAGWRSLVTVMIAHS
ncbi:uncharacterized protein LACBIDRAFT_297752 [Laccaria bicolor S238N-H82]|uniref:Predicted protein n=1 Tax=Laccaria bicolor (strain S238N-H82 / ATCC MYA-4686) TaxID=486041 RepID=B0DAS8_LACBS|nr:uncharacterized protein LACBIDRAFT_297752 [Laccaria bicolor S238N-H82]EDR08078.1 predicted protein [Laccaria bicolor S238N-H82]|eukprot:XP_001881148.1 predicted protein [Laccaria bicolor S238N-H82]